VRQLVIKVLNFSELIPKRLRTQPCIVFVVCPVS